MADSKPSQPTVVNGAIIDSVSATNTKVLAEAPAMAMGSLYQTIGNSVAMAAANAVYAQQQANVTCQAANTLGITKLFADNK
ncbi:RebB family R body protein [Shewanella surugensis]|uniref:RebB family R body protein n=1 Tax=Shewanella surugensis TaxID=212020 RepID=A0ABT0LEI0_9GAMM|nr:RebB family R body protein [Shewanella surugensis]MCL1126106.1 RebB family R body protein [Shewanella surugensis]